MAAEGIKEKATSFFKMFGSELAIEFYHDDIALVVQNLLKEQTPESLQLLIKTPKMLTIPNSAYEALGQYRELIRGYTTENLAKLLFELICEVRPDLGGTMASLGDESAKWMLGCTEVIRDRVVNPEKYLEEIEKEQSVKITCDNCHKAFRVFKEDIDSMKQCPFCGSKGEEPPVA